MTASKKPAKRNRETLLPRTVTPYQFAYWMDDNGLTTKEVSDYFHLTRQRVREWRIPKKIKRIPGMGIALMIYVSRMISGDPLGTKIKPLLCRCGCRRDTMRSHVTGCYNLYLPGHSYLVRKKQYQYKKSQRRKLIKPPLKKCPHCWGPLVDGEYIVEGKTRYIGQLCRKCEFKHLIREAS